MFKYNPKLLIFERINVVRRNIILSIVTLLLLAVTFELGRVVTVNDLTPFEKEVFLFTLTKEQDKFTQSKLIKAIDDLNLMHPDIIIVQSMLETGHYKKPIFVENNNLFGLKEAAIRATTCKGTNNGHAYYDTWQQSLYDYALYQTAYLRQLKSEDSYIDYLAAHYAEDPEYGSKLRYMLRDYRSQHPP